jgi:heat shock protein HslJ
MRSHFAAVVSVLCLVSACAGSAPVPAATTTALEGMLWTLHQFEGQPLSTQPITLRFESGTVSGRAPCNSVSASYTRDGDGLRFGPIATSKMYCADAAALEQAYLAALRRVDHAAIDGQTLTLRGAGAQLVYSGTPDN